MAEKSAHTLAQTQNSNSLRKQEQLRINLEEDIQFKGLTSGFEDYHFVHQALPELDLADVDPSTTFLGKPLRAPLLISPMTGGIEEARLINLNLARAAQATGIAMAVGSQRAAIEDPGVAVTYQVRGVAPDILLLANLGAIQLNYGWGASQCQQAVDMIEADGLILHLNPLQEALQPDGNTNFASLLDKIGRVCREISAPVIVKEVGWGISEAVARRLASAGVAGLDVAGAGGTSWSEVERRRADRQAGGHIAAAFADWGIPTARSLLMARRGAPGLSLIASGGIRTGVDAAKAIALGADVVGIAAPLLKPATISPQAVIQAIQEVIEALRIAMFCIGAATLTELKDSPHLKVKEKM
ncbi:MAG TPA: type 2 isopentenyl-diphosphate Delta-isomerase [Dehalococcoidia bacterium]|nr:type 2 isopentenyl-diphosphate Delta-isomerase [Dehalococcoidia bacterium]